jgi:hypothetical protein
MQFFDEFPYFGRQEEVRNVNWKEFPKEMKEQRRHVLTLNLQPASLKGQHMPNMGHWSLRCKSRSSRARMEASQWFGHVTGKRPHFV